MGTDASPGTTNTAAPSVHDPHGGVRPGRTLRRWRTVLTILAGAMALAMLLSRGREAGVALGGFFVQVCEGTLVVGAYEDIDGGPGRDPGLAVGPVYARRAWNADWTLAWRPFRMKVDYDLYWTREGIVFPLWPLLVVACLGAGYTHGVLAGTRRARTTHCAACGYDLRATPVTGGRRVCPECGKAQGASTA